MCELSCVAASEARERRVEASARLQESRSLPAHDSSHIRLTREDGQPLNLRHDEPDLTDEDYTDLAGLGAR